MDKELKDWFDGFESALPEMNAGERTKLYAACGQGCVKAGMLDFYRQLFEQAGNSLDGMFQKTNEMGAAQCEVIESEKCFTMAFKGCVCPMYIKGYASSPYMCECFEQSVKFVMETLVPDKKFEVTALETVLRGGEMCRVKIQAI